MSWQLSQQDSTASTAFRNEPEVAHIVHRLAEDWSGGYSVVLDVVLSSKTAANTGGVFKTLIGGSGVFGTATKFMRQTARQTQMRVAGSGMTITDSGTQITFASSGGGRVRPLVSGYSWKCADNPHAVSAMAASGSGTI